MAFIRAASGHFGFCSDCRAGGHGPATSLVFNRLTKQQCRVQGIAGIGQHFIAVKGDLIPIDQFINVRRHGVRSGQERVGNLVAIVLGQMYQIMQVPRCGASTQSLQLLGVKRIDPVRPDAIHDLDRGRVGDAAQTGLELEQPVRVIMGLRIPIMDLEALHRCRVLGPDQACCLDPRLLQSREQAPFEIQLAVRVKIQIRGMARPVPGQQQGRTPLSGHRAYPAAVRLPSA